MNPQKILIVAPRRVALCPSGAARVQRFYRPTAAAAAAGVLKPDVVVVSLALPGDSALPLCRRLRDRLGEDVVIVVCGPISQAAERQLPPRAALRRSWGADHLLPSPTPAALDALLCADDPPASGGVLEQVWRWATRAAS